MSDTIVPPACGDEGRPADLVEGPSPPLVDLNGIDFVEVDPADHAILRITFLKPLPPTAYGLPANPDRVRIAGGTRIVGIKTRTVTVESGSVLRVELDRGGDYSPYLLTLESSDLDPVRRSVVFSFMASCPTDADCRPAPCPPETFDEPLLDYLAKDYSSFRRMLLDLLPRLNPDWEERNPSDLAIALLELLAYEGDRLSYAQDAVANEAFLELVRKRVSARRHARLVDYRMHDGLSAWAAVCFWVTAPGQLAEGSALFTKLAGPRRGESNPPGARLVGNPISVDDLRRDPGLRGVVAFETAFTADLHVENNEIRFHTWGDEECCLAPGTREAYLFSVSDTGAAVRPRLDDGDYLVLEEVLGPRTGAAADADPLQRQLVRIDGEPEGTTDPLYARTLVGGLPPIRQLAQPALPLLRVRWRRSDALAFPLCLSARLRDGTLVRNVSVARGNVVIADHGLTTTDTPKPTSDDLTVDGRLVLRRGPLTMTRRDRAEVASSVREAVPSVSLTVTGPGPMDTNVWTSVPDLLDSPSSERHFVVEVDDDGRASLRFGDGEYGRALPDVRSFDVGYRVGNGRAGNAGAEAIAHVFPRGPFAGKFERVRNPLPAKDGTDSETIEEVRQYAPQAFHAELFRAVTEDDWAEAARRLPEIAGAVATYRWTGSWFTIFVAVDPRDRSDLVNLADGRTCLEPSFEARVRAFLSRFRLAGYDMELRPPLFVPVELEVEVCAAPGYFRTDVAEAVRDALSARVLPDGTRGFFHPEEFTFGQPLYVSRLYAAIERVTGVESVAIRRLLRYGRPDAGELERGVLAVAPWEIVQLEGDPNFVEHGLLTVTARGGKA